MSDSSAWERVGRRPIAVAGFMGVGKTTVGRLVAKALGRQFHDTDEVVEASSGRRVDDFFAENDEAGFRSLEARAVTNLLARGPVVLALGGGALLDEGSRNLLLREAVLVHLQVSWEDLVPRLPELIATRPLLRGQDPDAIESLFRRRQVLYLAAPIQVDVGGGTAAQAADQVLLALRRFQG